MGFLAEREGIVGKLFSILVLSEDAWGVPDLADRHSLQEIGEPAAMIKIRVGQDEAGQVWLTVALRKSGNQLVDDRDVLVAFLVGHSLVVDVDLNNLILAHDDGCSVPTTNRPKDERGACDIREHGQAPESRFQKDQVF